MLFSYKIYLFYSDLLSIGYLLNDATKLGLHALMLFAALFAYNQTMKLDINEHPISLLDDILLFICIPAFLLETVLSLVATINILNVVKTVDLILMVSSTYGILNYAQSETSTVKNLTSGNSQELQISNIKVLC